MPCWPRPVTKRAIKNAQLPARNAKPLTMLSTTEDTCMWVYQNVGTEIHDSLEWESEVLQSVFLRIIISYVWSLFGLYYFPIHAHDHLRLNIQGTQFLPSCQASLVQLENFRSQLVEASAEPGIQSKWGFSFLANRAQQPTPTPASSGSLTSVSSIESRQEVRLRVVAIQISSVLSSGL